MQKSTNYILKKLADECLLIPTGDILESYNGVITLSDSAMFIYEHIDKASSLGELINLLKEEYNDIDEKILLNDTVAFVFDLVQRGIIEPTDRNIGW